MGTIFVAGIYGVGKSTLCDSLMEEHKAAEEVARANGYPLSVHQMEFNENDISSCLLLLK